MIFNNNNEYVYAGVSLFPQIFAEIIFFLYKDDPGIYSRKDILNKVVEFHLQSGGVYLNKNSISSFKKATSKIENRFKRNFAYGTWQFLIDENTKFEDFLKNSLNKTYIHPAFKKTNIQNNQECIKKIEELKSGWVYFYYFSTYEELAIANNKSCYPIKIGKSANDPQFRINEQVGTALPEKPIVFLEIKTKDCSALEKYIHSFLILLEKRHKESIGKEWFLSNKKELFDLVSNLKNFGVELEIKSSI